MFDCVFNKDNQIEYYVCTYIMYLNKYIFLNT